MRKWVLLLVAPMALAAAGCSLLPRWSSHDAKHWADFGDTTVFYRDAGAGEPTIVFIHGWACDHTVWDDQIEGLRGDARMLAIDLPGQGRSDKPEHFSYSMDSLAGAVATVMDDAGVERAVIAGHSNGGLLARHFYRRYPARTAALVIVDEAILLPQEVLDQIKAFGDAYRGDEFLLRMEELVGQFAGHMEATDQQRIRAMVMNTPQYVAIATFEAALERAVWKADPIGVPVLSIMAENSLSTGDYEDKLRSIAPRVDYRVVPGVSHFLMMDRPADFDAALLQFLRANGLDP